MPLDSPSADALEEIGGRYVVRIERRLAHPVERVWDAITRPERIREWFAGVSEVLDLELTEGGMLVVRWIPELADSIVARSPEEPLVSQDTVLHVEPPHLLEHTLDGKRDSVVRWELQPHGGGCRLLLSHTLPADVSSADVYVSGWGVCLVLMRHALEGRPVDWKQSSLEEIGERYAAHPEKEE